MVDHIGVRSIDDDPHLVTPAQPAARPELGVHPHPAGPQHPDQQPCGRRAGSRPPLIPSLTEPRTPSSRPSTVLKRHRAAALRTDIRLYVYIGTVATIDMWLRDLTEDP